MPVVEAMPVAAAYEDRRLETLHLNVVRDDVLNYASVHALYVDAAETRAAEIPRRAFYRLPVEQVFRHGREVAVNATSRKGAAIHERDVSHDAVGCRADLERVAVRTGRAAAHHDILDDIADVVGFHAVRVVAGIDVAVLYDDVLAFDVETVCADAGVAVDLHAAGNQVFALKNIYAPRRRIAQGKVLQAHLAALAETKSHRLWLVVARIVVGPAVAEYLAVASHRNICRADRRHNRARHRPARRRVVRRIPRGDETSPLRKPQLDV